MFLKYKWSLELLVICEYLMVEIDGDDEVECLHQIVAIWKFFSGNIFQMYYSVFQIFKHPWPPSNNEIQTSGDGLEQGAVSGL